jgi:3'-phosphoadenosine 5'-phosphosulfate sulfotransferase (PAPS reductase)/FAD synthetase
MCLLYGKNATAIWADTGAEHEEMYARIDHLEKVFTEMHEGFTLVRVKANTSAYGRMYNNLVWYIRRARLLPSPGQRFCTDRFKITPIERYLKSQGECELLIGFNADEEPGKARVGNLQKLKNVSYRYPLYEDGFDRDDCEQLLRSNGLHPEFPVYMRRGGCFLCASTRARRSTRPCTFLTTRHSGRCNDSKETCRTNGQSITPFCQERHSIRSRLNVRQKPGCSRRES